MSETIKLVRLRGSLSFYKNLKEFLFFLHEKGYEQLSADSSDWKSFKEDLIRKGVDGLDLGDVKSTLRMIGIVNDSSFTQFGQDLFDHRDDEEYIKEKLAKLMLFDKKGWAYCEVLKKLPYSTREEIGQLYEEEFDRETFQEEYTDISKYNIFLTWLGVAQEGSHRGRYKLVEEIYNNYLGIVSNTIEFIDRNLRIEEKYCLMALIKLNSLERKAYFVRDIRHFVFLNYNKNLNTHNINGYGRRLQEKGYITYSYSSEDQSRAHQRGQQGMWLLTENPNLNEITLKILEDTIKFHVNWSLIDVITKSFSEIGAKLESQNDNERGIALEQFASKLCFILGLKNIKINYREEGLELDVVAQQEFPFFTKFLIQCKNKNDTTSPSVLYKEVGVATTKKFNNIMLFSKSGFSSNMRDKAREAMRKTGVNVFLFDGEDIAKIMVEPMSIIRIIERENIRIKEVRESTIDSED